MISDTSSFQNHQTIKKCQKKRSRSKERVKKARQRAKWTREQKLSVRKMDVIRKKKKGVSHRTKLVANKKDMRRQKKVQCPKTNSILSQYEQVRKQNIIERLEAMMNSGLWAKKEIKSLKKIL